MSSHVIGVSSGSLRGSPVHLVKLNLLESPPPDPGLPFTSHLDPGITTARLYYPSGRKQSGPSSVDSDS